MLAGGEIEGVVILETKFQYQVSPELAEKIAMEQFEVLLGLPGFKLRYLPLGMGFLVTLLLLSAPELMNLTIARHNYAFGPSTFQMGGTYYAFSENFISVPGGFVFGFGFGWLINYFIRARILAMARSAYQKMGPARTVSWNSEGLTFQSAGYETKVRWQMIDKIESRSLGVYGLFGRKAFFAIPREAFPPNATVEDLTRAWQTFTSQPPIKV